MIINSYFTTYIKKTTKLFLPSAIKGRIPSMIRRLYDWTYTLSQHPHAFWALFFIAFIESSIFPIPPDILLIPIIFANRSKAFRLATICTAGSVLGGVFGYGIGFFFFEQIGRPVLETYGHADAMEVFASYYNKWGAWIVAAGGFTPLPYKIITITSGVTHLDFGTFLLTSIMARGARFFMIAIVLHYFGKRIQIILEKHLGLITTAIFTLLIAGFAVIYFFLKH